MGTKKKKYPACTLSNLKEMGSIAWDGDDNNLARQCFLVYHEGKIHSYMNRCPHTGANLDWVPHQFLDSEKKLIQCATHGALFNIKDGLCLRGPCIGDRLISVENVLEGDTVYLVL